MKVKVTVKYLVCACLLLSSCMCAGTTAMAASPDKTGYELVWEDNFDGDTLNRNHWNVEINGSGCGNAELQYYIDDTANVAVRNGNLVLTARVQTYAGKEFTSGRVNTQGKVAFKYGIIEARIKFPRTANGLWPAFWMMGGCSTVPCIGANRPGSIYRPWARAQAITACKTATTTHSHCCGRPSVLKCMSME